MINSIIRSLLKRTPVYKWLKLYQTKKSAKEINVINEKFLAEWNRVGRPAPPPQFYKISTIKQYAKKNSIKTLIETGTYLGDTIEASLSIFERILSIELSTELFEKAKEKFAEQKNVKLYQGDSGEVLEAVMTEISEPCLFWLDGHYSEGFTAKGKLNTPIVNELTHILNHRIKKHVILIDDARCFTGRDDYPTIEELLKIVHQYDENLIFSVEDDIIRIHPKYFFRAI